MEELDRWNLGLFDPGMTAFHKVGLAGLYMTLKSFDQKEFESVGNWELKPHCVEIAWNGKPGPLFAKLLKRAFEISPKGLIQFSAHKKKGLGDLQRLLLHEVISNTFLQHPQHKEIEKKAKPISFVYEDKQISRKFKEVKWYIHQEPGNLLNNDDFQKEIPLKGWSFPGGMVRHEGFNKETVLTSDPQKFFLLLFAPIGAMYFKISRKTADGKFDYRKTAAIVLPQISDLENYCQNFSKYLQSPVAEMHATSLGEAGLQALLKLALYKPDGMIATVETKDCTVFTFGTVPWAKQQRTRTSFLQIRGVNSKNLNLFSLVLKTLENKIKFKDDKDYFVATSQSRGLFAENIASEKPWFSNFFSLMKTQKLAKFISFEREGLFEMVQKCEFDFERDRAFVTAVHQALKGRYGMLASRSQERGESPRFYRESERIRTSLMRAKNLQTMRAEVADLFARGGINSALQEKWLEILPIFLGSDWQKTKDLALLALASYPGAGSKELEPEIVDEEEI